ncbi:FAD-dependent oxidoreductase [Oligella urethralis]|uniref:Thiamine biosynthesis protein thio n=1 Tax=Oligella urethralis DNF00040 TaxID=1401065 RepID=A0A095Z9U7_9BURK|nr:FAD-dependent oxidoreductase [Oligella urethralis]KGF31550.1 thiamine biosynthesis protein thio [Oligella urethralis DNF00040]
MQIGIAGAGLAGRLLAYALSTHGYQVAVFDPAPDAHARVAAGWTAAGMLCPLAEMDTGDDDVYALGQRSLAIWAALAERMDNRIDLRLKGSLMLAHQGDEGAAEQMIHLLQRKTPNPEDTPRAITIKELRDLEPAIQGPAHAWLLPQEGQVDTGLAMRALCAEAKDVSWHWGVQVDSLHPGEIVVGDKRHHFDWVFDCRGVGARRLKYPHPTELSCQNVRGVRGEIFWVQAPEVALHRPLRLLHPRYQVYIVPRQNNIFVIGASAIESEDRSPVSLRTTVELLAAAHSVLPGLAEARLVHTETNLRPALVDNFPRIETEQGLSRINGLFRHGWMIAPAMIEDALNAALEIPVLATL